MYCTHCGRPLPSNGICPKCAKSPPRGAAHPMGKTVYDFCKSIPFLLLTLLWTLCTLWLFYCLRQISLWATLVLIPGGFLCLGLWITFFSRKTGGKRAGLRMASGALLAALTLITLLLAALCLVSFYGIFLCTSDSDYTYLVPGFLKLVLVLFLLMPFTILFLNKLRKILRTAQGVLRGNRGMALCPIFAILYCVLFAAGGIALSYFSTQVDGSLALVLHAISRLPFGQNTPLAQLELPAGQTMAPILMGLSASLLVTAVILVIYRVRLYRIKKEIVRTGGPQSPAKGKKADEPVQV